MQLEFNRKPPVSPPLDCKHTAVKCMLSQTHTLMFRERNLLQTLQVKKSTGSLMGGCNFGTDHLISMERGYLLILTAARIFFNQHWTITFAYHRPNFQAPPIIKRSLHKKVDVFGTPSPLEITELFTLFILSVHMIATCSRIKIHKKRQFKEVKVWFQSYQDAAYLQLYSGHLIMGRGVGENGGRGHGCICSDGYQDGSLKYQKW